MNKVGSAFPSPSLAGEIGNTKSVVGAALSKGILREVELLLLLPAPESVSVGADTDDVDNPGVA